MQKSERIGVIRQLNRGVSDRLQPNVFLEESSEESQEVKYPWDGGNV